MNYGVKNYPISKLIADFDGTVTQKDTISPLVLTAAENRSNQDQFLTQWEQVVQWYVSQQESNVKKWLSAPESANHLIDFLESFKPIEEESLRRVTQQQFLRGLTKHDLKQLGRNALKREGVANVLKGLQASAVEIEILSANWSKTLIQSAMDGLCDQIRTNHLVFDDFGKSTGEIRQNVTSAQDKLSFFEKYRSKTGKTLYIGDSITDFLAILSADIGVLIGDHHVTRQVIDYFEIPTVSITSNEKYNPEIHRPGIILLVDSWLDLENFLIQNRDIMMENRPCHLPSF